MLMLLMMLLLFAVPICALGCFSSLTFSADLADD